MRDKKKEGKHLPKAQVTRHPDQTAQIHRTPAIKSGPLPPPKTLLRLNRVHAAPPPPPPRASSSSSPPSSAAAAAAPELAKMVLQNDIDLLNPPAELEKLKHKKKRLVQSPNSFFMDVKCQGCFNITTVFSHSQTVVVCPGCQTVLCQPTGGKARLTEGCSFRRKSD
ncbi:40S ribosomal protein S27 [Oryza brachyantha]|nr:40S ribosomal protein S27 [Oryza brachyantha]